MMELRKKKNARSSGPKGKVHAIAWLEDNGVVHPECGYRSSYQAWIGDEYGYKWERTDDPVTCKNCLRVIEEVKFFQVTRTEAAAVRTVLEATKIHLASSDKLLVKALKTVRKWDLESKDGKYR